jgi:hypothetical protein
METAIPISRTDFVLATLALLDEDATFSPVQVQKIFFLLDKEIPEKISGPRFSFSPYDYGPFDADVYRELETLAKNQYAEIFHGDNHRLYQLSKSGRSLGKTISRELDPSARKYIKDVGAFVLKLNFRQLVESIYKAYPEMKAKSVFR